MSEELISKKDLLETMEISYGQLYRWKRKKLIPEEWFIKKSVSTGQETFFPREKIIKRVGEILNLKEGISLDELAFKYSNEVKNINIRREFIISCNIVQSAIIERYEQLIKIESTYDENSLFGLFLYEELLNLGVLGLEEANNITEASVRDFKKIGEDNYELILRRKLGVLFYYVVLNGKEIINDINSIEIARIDLRKIINRMKNII